MVSIVIEVWKWIKTTQKLYTNVYMWILFPLAIVRSISTLVIS